MRRPRHCPTFAPTTTALALAQRRLTRSEALLAGGAISADEVEDARQALTASQSRSWRRVACSSVGSVRRAGPHRRPRTVRRHRERAAREYRRRRRVRRRAVRGARPDDDVSRELRPAAQTRRRCDVGASVTFAVTGYPGPHVHRPHRAHESRRGSDDSPSTGVHRDQNGDGRLVAGLFAEGRVAPSAGHGAARSGRGHRADRRVRDSRSPRRRSHRASAGRNRPPGRRWRGRRDPLGSSR